MNRTDFAFKRSRWNELIQRVNTLSAYPPYGYSWPLLKPFQR